MRCSACGDDIPDRSRFCPSCGARLSGHVEERRVVSVVFADVVGFTTLSEQRDPEQVKELVDRCFQWLVADIVSFGGRVDKIIGDAVLALFGAPVAHEDDAERAVRAALRMQETVAARSAELHDAVRLRIGVNTGEVLVGALQAGGDYTAMGDVVNSADRLQAAARPGEVLVGETTWAATDQVIEYESRGVVPAKGRDEPLSAWTATAPLTVPGERPHRSMGPLVGRDAEVEVLRHAAGNAVSHGRASLLVLLGDAGMGKSRIASEVSDDLARSHSAVVLEGRCLPYGTVNAWWPVAEAIRSLIDVDPGESQDVVETRLSGLIARTFKADAAARTGAVVAANAGDVLEAGEVRGDGSASAPPKSTGGGERPHDQADEVARVTAGLLEVFGYEGTRLRHDHEHTQEEIVRSVLAFLDATTRQRPVIMRLSDLHWADEVVLDLIAQILEHQARRPLIVVATARRSLLERWYPPVGRYDTFALNLEALDAAATDALVDVLLRDMERFEVGDATRVALRERSGGNPLFLVELLSLMDEQRRTGTVPVPGDASLERLPDTLRGLVAARLDNLSSGARAVIDDAAVLGRRGLVAHLVEMAGATRGVTDVPAELEVLTARDLITIEGDQWEFRSDLTREIAYRMLTKSDRADKHLGVAQWIEAHYSSDRSDGVVSALAHHYGQAAELLSDLGAVGRLSAGVRERALHWIIEASARGELLRLLPAVERQCTQGLALADDDVPASRLTLLLRRARIRVLRRDAEGALADAAAARELALQLDDRSAQAAVLVVEGDLAQQSGNLDAARDTLDRAVRAYDEAGDLGGRADALRARGMAELFAGQTERAEVTTTEALEAFRKLGRRSGEAWALQNLAWMAFAQARPVEAEQRLGSSLKVFDELGDAGGAAWVRGLQGFVLLQAGDFSGADEMRRSVLNQVGVDGDRWATAMMSLLESIVSLWTGQTDNAVRAGREGLELFRAVHDQFGETRIAWPLSRALVMQGDVAGGLALLEEVERSIEHGSVDDRAVVSLASASSQVYLGRPDRALEALGWMIDQVSSGLIGDLAPMEMSRLAALGGGLEVLMTLGAAHLQAGRVDLSRAVIEEAVAEAGSDVDLVAVSALLALVRLVDGDDDGVAVLVERVRGDVRATYVDRTFVGIAAMLSASRRSDAEAVRVSYDDVRRIVDGTGDRVSAALVRSAGARALAAVGDPGAAVIEAEARSRLDELGVGLDGWVTVFELALGKPVLDVIS